MRTEEQLRQEYKASHPIGQNFHTGKFGFERVHDCLNLNLCLYKTEHRATIARAQAANAYVANEQREALLSVHMRDNKTGLL